MFPRLLLLTCLLLPNPLAADQNDPQLDALFARLRLTDDAELLRLTENQIWAIWMQHDNADVQRLLELATIRMNNGRFSEALVVYNEIVASYPDFAEAWNKRATLHYLAGNYEESLADIERVLELEPRHFGALSGKGLVYLQQGELTEAREAFTALLSVHPNSPGAQNNLELVEQELRRNLI